MFIYNVTIKLSESIHAEWLQWMKEIHVPEMLATNCFTNATVVRLLEIDDSEGPTYAIQFFAENKIDYDRYIEKYASALRQKSFDKWGNQFISFRSLMQVVN